MRVLAALAGAETRMSRAAAGLALRGHEVGWRCPMLAAPPGARRIAGRRALWGFHADVVVSDAVGPVAPAVAGWQAGAHALVLALEHARVRGWGPAAHWAWSTLEPLGLAEPREAEKFRDDPAGLDLLDLGLWSDDSPATEPDAAHADTEVLERGCERVLARHRSRAPRPAVFVDRDGTLVREVGYLADPADLELLPGVANALRSLRAAGYAIVVVSNQSGVGRGFFPLSRVFQAMARLRESLRAGGAEIDAVHFCPHRPEAGCDCRKPGTALLERAADDLGLDLARSYMIGDKQVDVETGRRAGATPVLVRTGYGHDEEGREPIGVHGAERVFDDLAGAAAWILERDSGVRD